MMQTVCDTDRFTVVVKPAGADSESPGPGLLCVHRLDKAASGIMIYAKDALSAAELSAAFSRKDAEKEYLAVVCGAPERCGRMEDLLFHDRRTNKTYVTDRKRKGVKEASLSYETLAAKESDRQVLSLVRIALETGRTHQIRVQFASRGMPLAGDGRYGSPLRGCGLALWSRSISFHAPGTGETLRFSADPDTADFPWSVFSEEIESLRHDASGTS